MGKYLYHINSDIGKITCRFADDAEAELQLREEGFCSLNEFTLEQKINAAFMSAAYLDERIDSEIAEIRNDIADIDEAVDDLEDAVRPNGFINNFNNSLGSIF